MGVLNAIRRAKQPQQDPLGQAMGLDPNRSAIAKLSGEEGAVRWMLQSQADPDWTLRVVQALSQYPQKRPSHHLGRGLG